MDSGNKGPGYKVVKGTVVVDRSNRMVMAKLQNKEYSLQDPLLCTISFLNSGTVRVQVTEENPLHKRWEAATPSADVLVPDTIRPMEHVSIKEDSNSVVATFGQADVVINFDPFTVKARIDGKDVLAANDLSLMNFEAYRPKTASSAECSQHVYSGPNENKYISDCPTGGCSTYATLQEAFASCDSVSDCNGIVMRPENGDLPYEIRASEQLKTSPSGETTYMKSCQEDCKFTAFSGPHLRQTLEGCTGEKCLSFSSLSAAQSLCVKLAGCGGIVKTKDGAFEIRSGTELKMSAEPETMAYLTVCSEVEPERKVVKVRVSGHNGIHSFRMGSYVLQETADNNERAVFKHETEDYYIYHNVDDKAWALGPERNDPNVWLYLKSMEMSPDKADGLWSYYDGDSKSWIEDQHMVVEAEEVELKGEGEQPGQKPAQARVFPPQEDGMWDESFGGHTDTKPRGPAAVAMDVSYTGANHVYGLAEHASPLALKNTVRGNNGGYTDPYRLYNLDVFEYDLDVPMALYGAIPLITAHSDRGTVSAFWLNSAETFVDIDDGSNGKVSHWISESGTIDLFLMLTAGPKQAFKEYALLTGFQALPQEFSLAYHQCRWNYKDEADVKQVDQGFDDHDIPYDTLWLDIEHTDGKKYFTWDSSLFPDPIGMQNRLKAKGRKMVTIIDPHIKRDSGYHVHKDAEAQDLYVHDASGTKPYEGWCWPGSVSYLDFFNPKTLAYWSDKFSFDEYKGSTDILYTWNDMNEPSVFNGPEVTMKKDALHWGDVEHRDVHNLYGMQVAKGTWHGQAKRLSKRPFVLTRSFFAGSQRFGAMWTGDNKAEWEHLRDSVPMLLSMGVSGFPFAGADVGGFFGDPDEELLLRWYQVGAFYPFFRGHGHIDTKRREPWLFGEPWTSRIRTAIRTRYRLLPYVYTLFYEAATEAVPVMRPLWVEFPDDKSVWGSDDSFMLGDALLIKPVVEKGATTASVYLPSGSWYDFLTYKPFTGGRIASVKAPLEKIPIFIRGGSILSTKERARRNSVLMKGDPYTLTIALDDQLEATGRVYLDDGESLEGPHAIAELEFQPNGSGFVISSKMTRSGDYRADNVIERIVILGLGLQLRSAELQQGGSTQSLVIVDNGEVLTLRKPGARIIEGWTITLN